MDVISVLWKFVAFVFFYFVWGLLILGPRHCRINCVLYDVDLSLFVSPQPIGLRSSSCPSASFAFSTIKVPLPLSKRTIAVCNRLFQFLVLLLE